MKVSLDPPLFQRLFIVKILPEGHLPNKERNSRMGERLLYALSRKLGSSLSASLKDPIIALGLKSFFG